MATIITPTALTASQARAGSSQAPTGTTSLPADPTGRSPQASMQVELAAAGAVARPIAEKLGETVSILDFIPVQLHPAIRAGTSDVELTRYIQAAIDHGARLRLRGPFLGGGIEIFFPSGRYRTGALIWKTGVNLRGAGFLNSQLLVSGRNTVMIAASANPATQTIEHNVFYGHFRDIAFYSWEAINGGSPVNQTSWDATGFSRWQCERVYFGWGGGHAAIRCAGATLAGNDGPTSFYNSFTDCYFERYPAMPGGTALVLGDPALSREQITTWYFTGGAIRGAADQSGTGVDLRSGSGCGFTNVVFEALDKAVVLGSPTGTRGCHRITFRDCYWEGNHHNAVVQRGCSGNRFSGGFVTGGAWTVPPGTDTVLDLPGQFRRQIVGSTEDDFFEVAMFNGAVRHPKFIGPTPRIGIEDGSGNELIVANNTLTSSADQVLAVSRGQDPWNLLQVGQLAMQIHGSTVKLNDGATHIRSGRGSPEGSVSAPAGSLYLRTDGPGGGATAYVKERGSGNIGWVAK